MNFFRMKLNAAGGSDQTLALQLIKSQGGDGIQISDGLCLRSPLDHGKLCALLEEKGMAANLTPVSASTPDLSTDEKTFLG